MEKEIRKNKKYYLSNRDLLIVAVLSGIGGVISTYVGYLGNLLNRVFGVPFGAGQFVSGLHVFWIILAAGLIRKPGAATAAGLLKGVIELFTGSSHGIAIVLVSLMQGVIVDVILLLTRRHNLVSYMLAGGIAAASNVLTFQLLYFSGAPRTYILFISLIALVSGVLLAGSFGSSVLEIVLQARPYRIDAGTGQETDAVVETKGGKRILPHVRLAITALLLLAFSSGAVYYYAAVFEPPWTGPVCHVEGAVEKPDSFQLSDFKQYETTVTAELKGTVTTVPAQDYTGVPLRVILQNTHPLAGAKTLVVTATDGYKVEFELQKVLADEQILLIREDNTLRLIAANYPGGHWVKMVNKLTVE
ncbi:MAG: ECF transporter S component [Desulfotomaculaceae bacterium]|nr:ECF transporter S component [Desulfotomaculaceae bacterium]